MCRSNKEQFRSGDRPDELTEAGHVEFQSADHVSGMTATIDKVRAFTALQLVWPDSAGHFPWQDRCRNLSTSQPLLGAPPR